MPKKSFVYTCHRFVSRGLSLLGCVTLNMKLGSIYDLAYILDDLSCNRHLCECSKFRIMSLFHMHIPYDRRIVLRLISSNCTYGNNRHCIIS